MSIKGATPYILLDGKAEQAIELYQRALGAKVHAKSRFGDMDPNMPEAMKNRIMHAELRLGDGVLMLSDGDAEEAAGALVNVAISFDDADEARRAFEALSSGGKVKQPIIDAPWGGIFGSLSDAFGVSWMFTTVQGGK